MTQGQWLTAGSVIAVAVPVLYIMVALAWAHHTTDDKDGV